MSRGKGKKRPDPAIYRYFLLNKPYGVISQFTDPQKKNKKLRWVYDFPKDVNPVGRLDKDSEGLLILTNDNTLHDRLLNPGNEHEKEYWVQVHGEPTQEVLDQLENGLSLRIEKKWHHTRKAKAKVLDPQPKIPARKPPISPRGPYPVVWISLTLTEGKYRQVRKMTAKVGLPTLRLIRKRITGLEIDLDDILIGEVREVSRQFIYKKLFEEDISFE